MEYTQFRNYFGKPVFGIHHDLFSIIQKYVTDEEVSAFYPKNLLIDGVNLEVIIFTDSDAWIFIKEESTIEVSVIKDFKVEKMKIIRSTGYQDYGLKLEIEFTSGDKLFLNSSEDTNDDWKETFSLYIEDLFQLLK